MPWWLHRILIIVLPIVCAFFGVFGILKIAPLIGELLGTKLGSTAYVILLTLGFFGGAGIPIILFKYIIFPKCPACGGKMILKSVVLKKRYEREIRRTGSRYICQSCEETR